MCIAFHGYALSTEWNPFISYKLVIGTICMRAPCWGTVPGCRFSAAWPIIVLWRSIVFVLWIALRNALLRSWLATTSEDWTRLGQTQRLSLQPSDFERFTA